MCFTYMFLTYKLVMYSKLRTMATKVQNMVALITGWSIIYEKT